MKFILFVLAIIGSSVADPFALNEEIPIEIPESLTFKDFFPGNESDTNSERIIGGVPAPIERFPWQISLRRYRRHICGGSILTAARALTAAHCLEGPHPPNVFQAVVGTTRLLNDGSGFSTPLSRFIRHPEFHGPRMLNDIAIFWFANPLPYGPTIQPIALPPHNADVPYGAQAVVSGWGLTQSNTLSSILLYTTAHAITNQECNKAYRGRITDGMVCAGVRGGSRGFCTGDSGGPLVANGVQIGIASWSRSCTPPLLGVYVRVSHYTNWIHNNV